MTRTGLRPSVRRTVRDNQTLAFVLLAFALSWTAWAIPLATLEPARVSKLALVPGAFGPAVAAAAVTWLSGESVREWLRSLRGDGPRRWLGYALAVPALVGVLVGAALVVDAGTLDAARLAQILPLYPLLLAVPLVVGGGQEELGWRGFALPRLQSRYSALGASLLLGGVWALWHLPLFVLEGGLYAGDSFALYAPAVLAISVVCTWLYNGSGGSVPAAMLLHAGFNAAPNLAVPAVGGEGAISVPFTAVLAGATWLVALAILVRHGPATLAPGDVEVFVGHEVGGVDPAAERAATEAGGVEA